ncbi:MAG: beta-ketoacyl-ACP synthase II, partial [Planctomycetota bacterium]|nr:beta-ketoacyl-ACP synthase II [Planctomycetota bacterium]
SRNGIVMTEGSTILLLEAASRAKERSAPIYGAMAGWGEASDASDLLAYPRSDAAVERALSAALRSAGIGPDKIGWLNASANSSLRLDPLEVSAISRVFAARAGGVATSSVKSYFGDSMASGALRAAASLLALRDGVIPPTLNLREPIEAAGVDHVIGAPREVNGIEAVLQDGVADGGDCLGIVFTKE